MNSRNARRTTSPGHDLKFHRAALDWLNFDSTRTLAVTLAVLVLMSSQTSNGAEPTMFSESQFSESHETAIADVRQRADELKQVNQSIWQFAEVGLAERKSSALLVDRLKAAGFDVTTGVSNMPTSFVARYGHGKPVIGILAEYDALPGMSQRATPERIPRVEGAAGHACGHSALGTAALGAALAVKAAMEKHDVPGTIRLYGTPAEETVIGKVYMALDAQFDDLDACLHWHPATKNVARGGSSKALVSAKFTFEGMPAHASVSPESGRSALDAVELMNVGANYMREHLKEDARMHYVITHGGGAPNVVPPEATVWYFVRADSHKDVEYNFRWLKDIANGAAMMTHTDLSITIDTDCHEIIPNGPLTALLQANLQHVGAPTFSDDEILFARRIQSPLTKQFGTQFPVAIDDQIHLNSTESGQGSTDVGDVSWRIPTGGITTTCFASESPGHSWQNVACIGSSIGEKGMLYAAKVLAVSALDLLTKPELLRSARSDFNERTKNLTYFSFIPSGQNAPRAIR